MLNQNTQSLQLLVFGATGGTGREFINQALAAGHTVTAVIRRPEIFALHHPRLFVIKGDVLDPSTYRRCIQGKDAVISCLGIRKQVPTTVFSEGVGNMIHLMQEAGIHRIICISAGAVVVPPKSSLFVRLFAKYILQKILRHSFTDLLRMERLLAGTNLQWTVIRPPRLTDKPAKKNYRVAVNEYLRNISFLSRADLAHYMLQHINDTNTYQAIVDISY